MAIAQAMRRRGGRLKRVASIGDTVPPGRYRSGVADPRLIAVELDESSLGWRSADVEQERRIAIFDLVEQNHFAPSRVHADGYAGPYRLRLEAGEGRLGLHLHRDDGGHLETLVLALGRYRRAIRDYLAMCDSYVAAIRDATPGQIETIDMARRALHNDAAATLRERLAGKIDIDFDTARRLFTLLSVLHLRG